jgi:hypothetical protein
MSNTTDVTTISIGTAFDRCPDHGIYVPIHCYLVSESGDSTELRSLLDQVCSFTTYKPGKREDIQEKMKRSEHYKTFSLAPTITTKRKSDLVFGSCEASLAATRSAFRHVERTAERVLAESYPSRTFSIVLYEPTSLEDVQGLMKEMQGKQTLASGEAKCQEGMCFYNPIDQRADL